MTNFTSNTYQMKREILSFSKKISKDLSKPERKFTADMTYGILASESCLLTDIVDQLHEGTKDYRHQCIKFLYHLMHGISGTYLYEARNKCTEGHHHKTSQSN